MRLLPVLLLSTTTLTFAQSVAFEVASIKPSDPAGGRTGMFTYPGGRVVVNNSPLSYIVQEAFDEQKILYPNAPS